MGEWTDYFFLSEDLDIIRFAVWHLIFFAAFTGSWIPIWRQSEKKQPAWRTKKWRGNDVSVSGKTIQTVIYYGYQTRKRREWRGKQYARWVLMNPDYFYNGFLWTIIIFFAAAGCYYAQTEGAKGDIRSVGLWLAGFQTTVFGMWSIAPFYWDMPGWGVLHLAVSSSMSIAVSSLFAYLDWWAFGVYSVFTVAQILLTVIYGMAFLVVLSGDKKFTVANPIGELLKGNGLHPVSFLERDIYPDLPMDPDEELAEHLRPPGYVPPIRNKIVGMKNSGTRMTGVRNLGNQYGYVQYRKKHPSHEW